MAGQPTFSAHVDLDEVVGVAAALVAVDTSNPPGGERPALPALDAALGRWVERRTEVEPEPGRVSLVVDVAHPDGPGDRPRLLVNGHLDVVPARPDAWASDPFEPTVRDGRLYGRGAADMKGGIAAAICALDVLARAGVAPACDLTFHLVADEEVGGGLGTAALLDAGLLRGDACLVPEPTGMACCIAERGLLQGHVTVHGRPGHASRPDEGASAIAAAAAMVGALHGRRFGAAAEHPLLGRTTCNVGTIEGGSGLNVVAETCRFGVDRRVLPGATAESTEAELQAHLATVPLAPGVRWEWQRRVFGEASELDPSAPFLGRVAAAVASATGAPAAMIGMSFTTDARFVRNQAGIPAVVCGPGDVAQAHVVDEWVSLERLAQATAAYAALFAAFDGA
ncbi:MAG TPA: ArgE/DapE family deacylase [Acidimicrobiales bacterium]|nr:ArgE/DapE family deacylase [Acidimicrobiales bacterium]